MLPCDTCLFPSAFLGSLPPWSPPLAPAYLSSSCWGSCQLPLSTSATSKSPVIRASNTVSSVPMPALHKPRRPSSGPSQPLTPFQSQGWWLKPGWELKLFYHCHAPLLLLALVLPFFLLSLPGPFYLQAFFSHLSPFPCSLWILSLLFNHQIPTSLSFSLPSPWSHRLEQSTPNLSPSTPCRQHRYHVHFAREQGRCCWGENWD